MPSVTPENVCPRNTRDTQRNGGLEVVERAKAHLLSTPFLFSPPGYPQGKHFPGRLTLWVWNSLIGRPHKVGSTQGYGKGICIELAVGTGPFSPEEPGLQFHPDWFMFTWYSWVCFPLESYGTWRKAEMCTAVEHIHHQFWVLISRKPTHKYVVFHYESNTYSLEKFSKIEES